MPKYKSTEDKEAAKWELELEGVHDFKELYKHMHDWWQDLGYIDVTEFDDKWENFYFERQMAGDKKEHWIWWRLKKEKTNFFRFYVIFNVQTLNMTKVDVMGPRGKKLSSFKVDTIVRCQSYLQIDKDNLWVKHPILKHFYRWFRHRAYLTKIKLYRRELYDDSYLINTWIKQYLQTMKKSPAEPSPFEV
jgi:hypothetical protein